MSILFGALNSVVLNPYPATNVLTRANKSQIGTVRSSRPSYSTILTLDVRSDVSNGAGTNMLDIKTHGQGGRFLWKNFKDLSTSYKTKKTDILFSKYIHYIAQSSSSSLPISGSQSTGPLDEQTVTFKTVPSRRNKRDVTSYNPYA